MTSTLGQIHDVRKQQIVMFDSILYLGESCEHWGGLNGRDFNIFCLSPYSSIHVTSTVELQPDLVCLRCRCNVDLNLMCLC